jgi:lipase
MATTEDRRRRLSVSDETFEVPVEGGSLRVARWGRGSTTVLAAHGLTGNHNNFLALAEQLGDEVTLIAPDLRGRGRSNEITGPFSIETHADDLASVLSFTDTQRAVVLGHSMGGFVGLVLTHRHPEKVSHLVLVDGGVPLDLSALGDLPIEQLLAALVGPALERLRMQFPSLQAYYDYWRAHPAFKDNWNSCVEATFEYDLVGEPPALRSSVSEAAVLADAQSELVEEGVLRALESLVTPTTLIRAERGIMNQVPPLYPDSALEEWLEKVPEMRAVLVPDVNHYTLLLSEEGAKQVADVVRKVL